MEYNRHSEAGKKGAATNRAKAIKKYYEDPAYCKLCGKLIEVYDGEMPSKVKKKMFCSSECRYKFQSIEMKENNNKKHTVSYCMNCGKELDNCKHKFCDGHCQQEFQYKEYIKKWENGEVNGLRGEYQISTYIQRYIKEKYDNKCCECGWNKVNPVTEKVPLEIHHIDGDYKNNSEDNLILLCPNCHSLTNTYKNVSGHEGRQGRNKYYKTKKI